MFEGFLSPMHLMIIGIIAILLFGDRLPEVMRSLGKGVSEFKKGMQGFQGAMNSTLESSPQRNVAQHQEEDEQGGATAPRFQPPTSEPKAEAAVHEPADRPSADHPSPEQLTHSPTSTTAPQPTAAEHSP